MPRPWSALLLVLVVVAQSALGGFRAGGAVLCLGGGHDHAEAATLAPEAGPCHGSCCDAEPWPTAMPVELHEGECACVDVDLSRSELGSSREDVAETELPALALPPVLAMVVVASDAVGHPADPPDPAPALVRHAAVLRTVRLLV